MAAHTPEVQRLLNLAMEALKRDDKAEARDLLTTVLEMDDRNEQAWLWMSGAIEDPTEQRICLENVLTINPGSTAAREGLAYLDKQGVGRAATAVEAAPATAAPDPRKARVGPPAPPGGAGPAPLEPAGPAARPAHPDSPPSSFGGAAPVGGLSTGGLGAAPPVEPLWMAPEPAAPTARAAETGPVPAWPVPVTPAPSAPPPDVPPLPSWAGPAAAGPAAPAPSASGPAWGAPLVGAASLAGDAAVGAATSLPATPLAPNAPVDPWEALRAEVAAGPAIPDEHTWPAGPAQATPADDHFAGLAPFDYESAARAWSASEAAAEAAPPLAADPLSESGGGAALVGVDSGVPLPLFHPEGDTGSVAALDSPWAATYGANIPGSAPPAQDPFIPARPTGAESVAPPDSYGSSPALIARPPGPGRPSVPTPTVACPNCSEMVSENALSCPRCQYRFYAACPNCGDFIDTGNPDPKGHDTCPRCGKPVDKLALGRGALQPTGRRPLPATTGPKMEAAPGPATAPGKKGRRKGRTPPAPTPAQALGWEPAAPLPPPGPSLLVVLIRLIAVIILIVALLYILPIFFREVGWPTLFLPGPTPAGLPTPGH